MIKVNVAAFKTALKKTRGFSDKTIVLNFEDAVIPGSEAHPLMLEASNGTAQSTIGTVYYGDVLKEKIIVSASIIDAIETISAFGEELFIEVMDGCLKLICGDAETPIAILNEAVNMEIDMGSEDSLKVNLKASDFTSLVANGGMATGDSAVAALFSGTVIFTPVIENEKYYLKSLSCCGFFMASAMAEVDVKDTDVFSKFAGVGENKQRNTAVNYASLLALAKRFVSEDVELYFTSKQMIVKDGRRDIYIFTIIEGNIPTRVVNALKPVEKEFEFSLDGAALKNALAVISLTNSKALNDSDKLKARLSFSGDLLTVEDAKHTSRAAVPVVAVKDGLVERAFNAECLKSIANMSSSGLKVYGAKYDCGVYFEGVSCKAYLLPVIERESAPEESKES